MFVTTVMHAISLRNDDRFVGLGDQASPCPNLALPSNAGTCTPMTAAGSRPAARASLRSRRGRRLPWAPATAIPARLHDLGEHSPRRITGRLGAALRRSPRSSAARPTRPPRRPRRRHAPRRPGVEHEPESRQAPGDRRRCVRSAHECSEADQHFCDRADAAPADADAVNRPRLARALITTRFARPADAAPARGRDRRSPPGRRTPRLAHAPLAIRARRPVSPRKRKNGGRQTGAGQLALTMTSAAPVAREHVRVLALVIVGRRRQRNQHPRLGSPPYISASASSRPEADNQLR